MSTPQSRWERGSCHTGSCRGQPPPRRARCLPAFSPRWDLSQITDTGCYGQREASHQRYLWLLVGSTLRSAAGFTAWLYSKTPSLLYIYTYISRFSWESTQNHAAITSRLPIWFLSYASLLTQPQTVLEKLRLVSRYLQVPLATQADFEPEDSSPVPSIWHPALLPAPPNVLGAFPPFSSVTGVHISSPGRPQDTLLPERVGRCRGHPRVWMLCKN